MREFERPRLWLGLWVFGWGLCIALSLLPPIELGAPRDSDKLGHFLAYATLSGWAALIFRSRRAQLLAAVSLFVLGVGMEVGQAQLTTTRLGDARDALANSLGILAGWLLALTPAASVLQRLDRRLFAGD